MTGVSQIRIWLLALFFVACVAPAGAAAQAAAAFAPLAHSTQLTLETASAPGELVLRLKRTQGTTPLAVTDLTVAIDGRNAPITRRGDDTWSVTWAASGAPRAGQLEAVVTHDGIREVLSGSLPGAAGAAAPGSAVGDGAPGAGHTSSVLRDHKQLAWWILNITVVLIAAIAISRRTS